MNSIQVVFLSIAVILILAFIFSGCASPRNGDMGDIFGGAISEELKK